MKVEANYRGLKTPNGNLVTCDAVQLQPRLDLRRLSPNGFEWGYENGGSGQLALAILADFAGDSIALDLYQKFQRDIISSLGSVQWNINAAMLHEWIRKALKEQKNDALPGNMPSNFI